MTDILPTFSERSFLFSSNVPRHIEGYPDVPNFIGLHAVFGASNGDKVYPLAVDIQDYEVAHEIAVARVAYQEATIEDSGYTDDVYVSFPNGENVRIYYGRSTD